MAKSFCDASKQPDIESHQDCELEACLSRYYWKAEYGYCMAPCGEGQFKYFLLHVFSLERLNFRSGWMCLFFYRILGSDVLICVLKI